jgi:hypothetical protein
MQVTLSGLARFEASSTKASAAFTTHWSAKRDLFACLIASLGLILSHSPSLAMIMISKDWWKFNLKSTYQALPQVKVSRMGGRGD